MKTIIVACSLVAGLSIAGTVRAEMALTPALGSTGASVHLTMPIEPNINARIGVNGFNYSHSASTRSVDYDFKLKFNTFDALVDWYPSDSLFRLSGGLAYNNTRIDAYGVSNTQNTYTLNGTVYNAASLGNLDGRADFRRIAPYLGIGWGNPFAVQKGWSFSGDLGVYFMGSASTSLTHSNCALPTVAQCTQLTNDVAAENANLNDKARDYKYYPVLRVGASYRF
ncbi:MAG: hypothetical protein ACRYGK_02785 [Janthinobacterium lividum]